MPARNTTDETGGIADDPQSVYAAERRASFATEDERWTRSAQVRDWLVLLAMIAVSLAYHFAIFWFQPGLR